MPEPGVLGDVTSAVVHDAAQFMSISTCTVATISFGASRFSCGVASRFAIARTGGPSDVEPVDPFVGVLLWNCVPRNLWPKKRMRSAGTKIPPVSLLTSMATARPYWPMRKCGDPPPPIDPYGRPDQLRSLARYHRW